MIRKVPSLLLLLLLFVMVSPPSWWPRPGGHRRGHWTAVAAYKRGLINFKFNTDFGGFLKDEGKKFFSDFGFKIGYDKGGSLRDTFRGKTPEDGNQDGDKKKSDPELDLLRNLVDREVGSYPKTFEDIYQGNGGVKGGGGGHQKDKSYGPYEPMWGRTSGHTFEPSDYASGPWAKWKQFGVKNYPEGLTDEVIWKLRGGQFPPGVAGNRLPKMGGDDEDHDEDHEEDHEDHEDHDDHDHGGDSGKQSYHEERHHEHHTESTGGGGHDHGGHDHELDMIDKKSSAAAAASAPHEVTIGSSTSSSGWRPIPPPRLIPLSGPSRSSRRAPPPAAAADRTRTRTTTSTTTGRPPSTIHFEEEDDTELLAKLGCKFGCPKVHNPYAQYGIQ